MYVLAVVGLLSVVALSRGYPQAAPADRALVQASADAALNLRQQAGLVSVFAFTLGGLDAGFPGISRERTPVATRRRYGRGDLPHTGYDQPPSGTGRHRQTPRPTRGPVGTSGPTTARLVLNGTVHGTDLQRALTEIGYPGVDFDQGLLCTLRRAILISPADHLTRQRRTATRSTPQMTWKSGRAKSWGQAGKARIGEERRPPREPDQLRSRLAFSGSTPSDRRQVRWRWCFVTAPQEAAATVYFGRISLVLADWMIAMATSRVEQTPAPKGPASGPTGGARIGWIVAGSLATGLVAALLLPFAPFIPAEESAVTGAVLCGFALGWAMLAVLSVRFTDQPQRWAAVPALFMGLGGLLLIAFGSPVHGVLDWVWPPALLALAIWMFVCVRRQLRSRTGRWLLYPVIGLLALAAIGGGYATVGAAADARAYPMAGQLIDVGGHRLHLNCTGSGSPDRRAPTRRRRDVVEHGMDRAGRRPEHPGLRLRPRRPRMERTGRHSPGRPADRRRPPHPASARRRSRDPTCSPAIRSAASTCSATPPATPARSPAWC